jgi:hypothetical protein
MRIKLRSDSRLTDLTKVSMLSIIITTLSVLLGMYAFPNQGCIADYFIENSMCKSCRDIINPFCKQCDDRTACNTCDKGYYPFDLLCIDCTKRDSLCQECDSTGCL